jgi:thymidylate synthase (FAD)
MKIKCLDKGYVELLNHTPDGDLLVVNAARCSFDKEHKEFDEEKDARLINYLAKHKHLLPFRHPNVTIRIHAPLFVLRQLGKHQVGFSWSEVSRRYIKTNPEFYLPEEDNIRARPDNIKQGSSGIINDSYKAFSLLEDSYEQAFQEYCNLLDLGVCPEQARILLPQAMYTTTVTTGTLLGWHHMFTQRTEEHTQQETQQYAIRIGDILNYLYPISWKALCKH